jgi:hypothetical protein
MKRIDLKWIIACCLVIGSNLPCQAEDKGFVAIYWKMGSKAEMHISVSNQLAKTAHFICGVEQKISGEWREVVQDISRGEASKSALINHLEPQRSVNFKWQRKTYTEFISLSEGVFRVKATPTDRLGAPKGDAVFSQEITLKR